METVKHVVNVTDDVNVTLTAEGETLYLAHVHAAVQIDQIIAKLHAQRFLVFKHAYAARADEAAKQIPVPKREKKQRKTLKLKQTA